MNAKNTLIALLLLAVLALGYLYWDSQQAAVDIRLPGVSIKGG